VSINTPFIGMQQGKGGGELDAGEPGRVRPGMRKLGKVPGSLGRTAMASLVSWHMNRGTERVEFSRGDKEAGFG